MSIKEKIAEIVANTGLLDLTTANNLVTEAPSAELGDYSLPCFALAKELKRSPAEIAKELQGRLPADPLIREARIVGPYLNFFVQPEVMIQMVALNTLAELGHIGLSDEGNGKKVIMEFSSANIAKSFHVGHGYSTILGQVLSNLYKRIGYEVVRFNHLGDYGTQFGKLIYAWKEWGDEEALQANPLKEMLRIYVLFHKEAEDHPELEDYARQEFKALEDGEDYAVAIWERFRELSIEEFKRIYKRLNIDFENWNGEAFYSKMMPEIVTELEELGLLEESEGAKVVMLDDYNLNPCIIQKSDGTSIYATRDLAAIKWRKDNVNFDKNVYVVGKEQSNHFKQLFAVLDRANKPEGKQCVHVDFGRIKFADGDFSTRKGQVIGLSELLDRAVAKTKEIILASPNKSEIEDIDKTAEIIGVDAVIFTYIKNSRERDIFFSWDEALSFEGDSAPYLLYSYARARSILRKADAEGISYMDANFTLLKQAEEVELAKLIDALGEKIELAAHAFEPAILVRQIMNIARAFNSYYHQCQILKTDNSELRAARLRLVYLTAEVLKEMMELIGLKTVEKM